MPNWKHLQKLNNGEAIWYSDPQLSLKGEVWLYSAGGELRVWSDGTLSKNQPEALKLSSPVQARFTLFKPMSLLFVDVEVRGAQAVVRRGTINGAFNVSLLDATTGEALVARYRTLGFRDANPWNATKKRVVIREYIQGDSTFWAMKVDGPVIMDGYDKETATESHEAAIERAEKRIRAKEKVGFVLRTIDLRDASHPNPEPKAPKGAPKKPSAPKGPSFTKPKNAYEAVDTAIAMLKDLHDRYPKAHFVAEHLDVKKEPERMDSLDQQLSIFKRQYKHRIGSWEGAKALKPLKKESSWDYFQRVYGTVTWIVDNAMDRGLPTFPCGNVTGGGWSCLEIADDVYDIDGLVEATENKDLENLFVFHGGWHVGRSFAFDQRTTSPTGEHAVISFDEGIQDLPKKTPAGRIQPFGLWLHKHVTRLIHIAEENLREGL
ncbi:MULTISPECIES: hypothetical protein [unclassified Myxococcus]|uniref:hypothetical protein n=1 Tax=unclassified Myxococcus TaxID=2648731 RepID=UPI0020C6C022|nr:MULTISPECIES: hypothetical protein [unclassified Myxococcus]